MITTTIMIFAWLAGLYTAYKLGEIRFQIKQTKQLHVLLDQAKGLRKTIDTEIQDETDNKILAGHVENYMKFVLDGLFNILMGRPLGTSFEDEEIKP